MLESQEGYLGLAIIIVIIGLAIGSIGTLTLSLANPIVVSMDDKSNTVVRGRTDFDNPMVGADIIGMLTDVSKNERKTTQIKINDMPIITLDENWVTNIDYNMRTVLDENGVYNLNAIKDWHVKDIEYVYNDGDPYWQYSLQP